MMDLRNIVNEFDKVVFKAIYYINEERKTNTSIYPKYRTVTSFMRCNEKSDHYEIYKKYPDVSRKYKTFSSDSIQLSLKKLVNNVYLKQADELFFPLVKPEDIEINFYGKLQLTISNFVFGLYSMCFSAIDNTEENMDRDFFEVNKDKKTICKFYIENNKVFIMFDNNSYEINHDYKKYNSLKSTFKKYINDYKQTLASI